jgi:hypothetical protein
LLLEQYHDDLVYTLTFTMNKTGVAYIFAPPRGNTLSNFIKKAEEYFIVEKTEYYKGNVNNLDKEFVYQISLKFK